MCKGCVCCSINGTQYINTHEHKYSQHKQEHICAFVFNIKGTHTHAFVRVPSECVSVFVHALTVLPSCTHSRMIMAMSAAHAPTERNRGITNRECSARRTELSAIRPCSFFVCSVAVCVCRHLLCCCCCCGGGGVLSCLAICNHKRGPTSLVWANSRHLCGDFIGIIDVLLFRAKSGNHADGGDGGRRRRRRRRWRTEQVQLSLLRFILRSSVCVCGCAPVLKTTEDKICFLCLFAALAGIQSDIFIGLGVWGGVGVRNVVHVMRVRACVLNNV